MENSDSLSPQLDSPSFWDKFKNTKNFLCSLPNFLMALAFMFPSSSLTKFLALSRTQLGDLMEIEFIVIHSFPFIVMFYFWKPEKKWHRVGRVIAFWGLLGLYIMMTSQTYGFWGLAVFCGLTMTTYIGFLLRITSPKRLTQLFVRWGLNFVIFIFFAIIFDMPKGVDKWHYSNDVIAYGVLYFTSLGLVEIMGFYQLKWIEKIDIEKIIQQGNRRNNT